ILVNNAAEQHETDDPLQLDAKELERTFRTNLFGYFFMVKAALPHLKKGASILNTTSVTAYKGHQTLLSYAATKGAIVSFTRSLPRKVLRTPFSVEVRHEPLITSALHGRCVPWRLELVLMGSDCVLIPGQADSGNLWNMQHAVLYIVGSLQNGIGPVLPLEPM